MPMLCLARPDGSVVASVTGRCRGRIGHARRGTGGFGYDPLFVPETEWRAGPAPAGSHPPRTMSELSPEEKDAISHRGEASRRLRPILEALVRTLDESGAKR